MIECVVYALFIKMINIAIKNTLSYHPKYLLSVDNTNLTIHTSAYTSMFVVVVGSAICVRAL